MIKPATLTLAFEGSFATFNAASIYLGDTRNHGAPPAGAHSRAYEFNLEVDVVTISEPGTGVPAFRRCR